MRFLGGPASPPIITLPLPLRQLILYMAEQWIMVYRFKPQATLRRNFQFMRGAKWLEILLEPTPDRGEQRAR